MSGSIFLTHYLYGSVQPHHDSVFNQRLPLLTRANFGSGSCCQPYFEVFSPEPM